MLKRYQFRDDSAMSHVNKSDNFCMSLSSSNFIPFPVISMDDTSLFYDFEGKICSNFRESIQNDTSHVVVSATIENDDAFKVNEELGCYNYTEEQEQVFYTFDNTMNYIIGFVGFLGLVGNFLCTITLGRKEMRSNCFHQLCLGLVIFDSLHILFAFLEGIYWAFRQYYPHFLLMIYPWFHYPLYRITLVGSIYMVISTSVERYLAVCYPHSFHRMSTLSWRFMYYLVPAAVGAIVVCFPKFFEIEIKPWCHNTTHYRQDPDGTELRYNHAYIIGYVQCFYMITTMILPLVILIVLSLRIYQGLIKVRKNLNRHKRLVDKAETANLERHETINAGVEECNIKVNNVIEEEEDGAAEDCTPTLQTCVDTITEPADDKGQTKGEEEEDVVGDETIPLQDMNKNGFNNGEAEDAVSNTTDKTNLTVNQNGHAADTVVSIVSSTPETNTNNRVPLTRGFNKMGSTIRTKTAIAQRKLQNAAQKREANMAVVLVSTVIMFVICHTPRMLFVMYEAIMHEKSMTCRQHGQPGLPFWYLYAATIIKLLQVWNAAGNFLIYYFMGTSFRQSFHALFK